MSCLREVQTISKSPNILPMPSLTRLTTGGVLNPLKNTTKIGHNKLLHQEPLQPPLEPRDYIPRSHTCHITVERARIVTDFLATCRSCGSSGSEGYNENS